MKKYLFAIPAVLMFLILVAMHANAQPVSIKKESLMIQSGVKVVDLQLSEPGFLDVTLTAMGCRDQLLLGDVQIRSLDPRKNQGKRAELLVFGVNAQHKDSLKIMCIQFPRQTVSVKVPARLKDLKVDDVVVLSTLYNQKVTLPGAEFSKITFGEKPSFSEQIQKGRKTLQKVTYTLPGCLDRLGPVIVIRSERKPSGKDLLVVRATYLLNEKSAQVRCIRANTQSVELPLSPAVDPQNLVIEYL